jgi:BNR repeat-like domain
MDKLAGSMLARVERMLLTGALGLLLTQCVRFGPIPPVSPTIEPTLTPVAFSMLIDTSEDDKALGYPDQRKLVVDSQGRLYAAYRKQHRVNSSLQYHIFVARSEDRGKTWSVLNNRAPVENAGAFTQRVPALAIDARDALHLVWYGGDADNSGANQRQIKYARSTDGGAAWSDWRNIVPIAGYAEPQRLWQEHPTIHVIGDTLYVVWQGRDAATPNRSQVRMAQSRDGGVTWTVPVIVQRSEKGGRSRPVLVAGGSQERELIVLAYGETEAAQTLLFTRSFDAGETWSQWTAIDANGNDQRHVTAATDNAGRLHVAWREGGTKVRAFVRYSYYEAGRWSPPVAVDTGSPRYQFFPSIAVTGDDRVVLCWLETGSLSGFPEEEFRAGTLRWASTRAGSDRWTTAASLAGDAPVNFVSLSADPGERNRMHFIWSEPRSDRETRLMYGSIVLR